MNIRHLLKRVVPQPIARAIRKIVPAQAADPFAPFRQSEQARSAARMRYARADWPDSARPRAIYALTPTANLRNVGDQAQAVAIERWLARHYPTLEIVELDKDVVLACIDDIRRHVTPQDLIFLHSGGNLGDRGKWSEAARRTMIAAFPDNRIISLPQTIFFSDTPRGRHEREITREVYGRHRRLTVIGRDEVSGQLAAELFPHAQISTLPDFVLSLRAEDMGLHSDSNSAERIMACLRMDDESALGATQRSVLADHLGDGVTLFDTTLSYDISAADRVKVLRETLQLFNSHRAVVTDRFHGLIFSVICRKPVVVLPTVDHKLTSAVDWFRDIPNVRFCPDLADLPGILAKVEATAVESYPDFNELYFDRLPQFIAEPEREPSAA